MKKLRLLFIMIIISSNTLFGQTGKTELITFDFVDQPIREILFAMSSYSGIPIIGDDTVSGTASFQYNGSSFEQALDSFLMANRLFMDKTGEVWVISRIKIVILEQDDTDIIVIDSFDSTPSQIIDKITRRTNATILQDILPNTQLTIHLETNTPHEAVELIMKPFFDYSVEASDAYIQISKAQAGLFPGNYSGPSVININEIDGAYDVELEHARLTEVLERLFSIAGKEYISFIKPDQMIDRVKFSGRTLYDTIAIILEQGGGEYREIGDLLYFFPRQQADIITELKNEGKNWHHFETRYLSYGEVLPLLQNRFTGLSIMSLPNNSTFLAFVDNEISSSLEEYLRFIDQPRRSEPLKLKFIKTDDLFKSLPPTAKREELVDAGDGSSFFFLGSAERKALFMKDLEIIDRPRPRIRYDLFIIQVQDSTNLTWSASAEARMLRPGDRTTVTGQLGNLFNLNFDVITVFGYQFAAKLNAAISENQASVFADTTLFGVSGQEIKFQNTSTYRYRDSNIDPDTGKPIYSGVTREIISGLVLEISGWVSGDGMVTTNVTAAVSKRGAEVPSTIGNPPPTSEKVLTTQVRARSGETVILSGLRQNDSTIIEQRMPFISKIPVLGWLFKSKNNTTENTQMIIYLVPHVDLSSNEYTISGLKTASIYSRFIEPFLEEK